jgi:hypothetical protein
MSEVPQSPSVSKPRSPISPSSAYLKLHRELSRLGCDLRKADALWRRAEESLATENDAREHRNALLTDLTPAQRALDAASGAYSWYAKAIAAAGSPPDAVRAIAEPLDEALKVEQRKVAKIQRAIAVATPPFFHGAKAGEPAPHMRLIHQAEAALIDAATGQAQKAAREVATILDADAELFSEHPERIPDDVSALIAEVALLDDLAVKVGWIGHIVPAFEQEIDKKPDLSALIVDRMTRAWGIRISLTSLQPMAAPHTGRTGKRGDGFQA